MVVSIFSIFALATFPFLSSAASPHSTVPKVMIQEFRRAFKRQVNSAFSTPTSNANAHQRDLAAACLTIGVFALEKEYEDSTGVSHTCTCGPVQGVGLSSDGVLSCVSNAPYCWIELEDGEEFCAKVEIYSYFTDNFSLAWLFGTVFADTVSLELTLDYFSGPWAGGKFNIVFKDYTCLDDEGEEEACICEATFDESMCTSCNVCALEGQGGNDFDCTNVNNKVVRTCRDKSIDSPETYPMTESIFGTTLVSTVEPTSEPTVSSFQFKKCI